MDDFAKFEGWGVIWAGVRFHAPKGGVVTFLSVYDTEEEARSQHDSDASKVLLIAPMSELLNRCLAEPAKGA